MPEETIWLETKRRCDCCGREALWAKLTPPSPTGFGKRLYTFICRTCDLTPDARLSPQLERAMRSTTGYDPRDDPELID